jgi:hypothetical protein
VELFLEVAVGAPHDEFGLLGGDLLLLSGAELGGQAGDFELPFLGEPSSLLCLVGGIRELAEKPEVLSAQRADVGSLISVCRVLGEGGPKLEVGVMREGSFGVEHVVKALGVSGA